MQCTYRFSSKPKEPKLSWNWLSPIRQFKTRIKCEKHGLGVFFRWNIDVAHVSDNFQHFSKFDLFDLFDLLLHPRSTFNDLKYLMLHWETQSWTDIMYRQILAEKIWFFFKWAYPWILTPLLEYLLPPLY